jgi:hypothetical protein
MRFAETLPDDVYRLDAFGVSLQFELDLGAKITAVVPQPIAGTGASRSQARNQIIVYFNDDDLNVTSAEDPGFYQLIYTRDTVTNTDDGSVHRPTAVDYDASQDRAVLTFASNIDELSTGPGTYRLRIGSDEGRPDPPEAIVVVGDPGSSFDTATDLDLLLETGKIISSRIDVTDFPLDYPGDSESPGHRDLSWHTQEQHLQNRIDANGNLIQLKDLEPGTTTVATRPACSSLRRKKRCSMICWIRACRCSASSREICGLSIPW